MLIVKELQKLQKSRGYLARDDMRSLAERLREPLHRIHEVASFFPHFLIEKQPPQVEVHVCRDMACHRRGALALIGGLEKRFEGTSEERLAIHGASCLGRCDRAPCGFVTSGAGAKRHERLYAPLDAEKLSGIVTKTLEGSPPEAETDEKHKTDRTSWLIDPYLNGEVAEPYAAVRGFCEHAGDLAARRQGVLKSLETAGLLGMGGAGGRAFKKWNDVLTAHGKIKYVVCNGDESEPGTFKDREILLQTPHLVVEGMIIGALTVGAEQGYVYIRHEYEEQIEAVDEAIRKAYQLNVLGDNVLGSGLKFHLESFTSPGGYICGEATALINAIESRRAEPRNRPPELQTNGLWNLPTVVNNVETWAWVPDVLLKGEKDGTWYSSQGVNKGRGRRLFSISGDLVRPGVYEVDIGITLRDLIFEKCGGIRNGEQLKAVALSGPSGGALPARIPAESIRRKLVAQIERAKRDVATLDGELKKARDNGREDLVERIEAQKKGTEDGMKRTQGLIDERVPPRPPEEDYLDILDLELDLNKFRKLDLMLGGGMVVYSDGADMVDELLANTRFYRNESCGKCVPCRLGSQKLTEILEDIADGKYDRERLEKTRGLINDVTDVMRSTAICGLGNVAPNPISTLIEFFDDDVAKRLRTGGPSWS